MPHKQETHPIPVHEVGAAIDSLDGSFDDDDALEPQAPVATPVSRRSRTSARGGTASARRPQPDEGGRSSGRQTIDPPPPGGSGFLLRLLMGMLGAIALVVASAGLHHADVLALWSRAVDDASFPTWQAYGVVAALVLGGSLVVGLIAALHDRSAWRVLWLGIAWAAVLQIGLAYHAREVVLLEPVAEDHIATGLAMAQVGLAPGIAVSQRTAADHQAEREALQIELATQRERAENLQAEVVTAQSALAESAQAAEAAAETARTTSESLQARLGKSQQELSAVETRLGTAQEQLSEVEEQHRLATRRSVELETDLQAAKDLTASLETEVERLNDEVRDWRSKAEAAIQALEQTRADAAATNALSGER